jgi:hypothetical protein
LSPHWIQTRNLSGFSPLVTGVLSPVEAVGVPAGAQAASSARITSKLKSEQTRLISIFSPLRMLKIGRIWVGYENAFIKYSNLLDKSQRVKYCNFLQV